MKILIGYSHVDAAAALRLLLWMDYLGGVSVPVCVVATQRAAKTVYFSVISDVLRLRFANSEQVVLTDGDERGWPHSATHLFARALTLANDEVLWLEADAVPMHTGWFEEMLSAYLAAGTTFFGACIPAKGKCHAHMTGCGFYRRKWRQLAPEMGRGTTGPFGAWDLDCAQGMLSDFKDTPLIQHFWQRDRREAVVDIQNIRQGVALYHQCKDDRLIRQINPPRDHDEDALAGDAVTNCATTIDIQTVSSDRAGPRRNKCQTSTHSGLKTSIFLSGS